MNKALIVLTTDEAAPYAGQLMGFTVIRDTKKVRVLDNWVNRIVLGLPLGATTSEEREYTVPEYLEDFQKKDVQYMCSKAYSLNRNKMGAGKTVEFIALCRALNADSVLVVCPKAVIAQWVAQFKKWWPERADDAYEFTTKSHTKRGDIVVTNYEKVSSLKYAGEFLKFTWDVFGVDEAHMIKNPKSQRTQAVKRVPAKYRNALTGTPIMRNPDDLYSILQFLSPDITGNSYWNFVEYFCNVKEGFFGREINGLSKDERHVKVLQRILDEISVYNDIEVAQGKRQIFVPLVMVPAQRTLYNNVRRILLDQLPATITLPNGAVQVLRLLQITSCPAIFEEYEDFAPEEGIPAKVYPEGAKFDWILGMLESDAVNKIVVYSKFARVVIKLEQFLTSKGYPVATFHGGQTAVKNRIQLNKFATDENVRVLAGTIDALGTGIDGLQDVCNVCVFIDRDYRPSINEQAEDRLHRAGQTQQVLCYYLECEKTVDKRIAQLNTNRTAVIRKLLEEKA